MQRLEKAYALLSSDPGVALSELRSLAAMESPSAAIHIGRAYERGVGVSKNEADAELWYRQAANLGLVSAYYFLGRLFLRQARCEDALTAFRHAAARDYPPALHYLGRMFYFGIGVRKDKQKSKDYLERAIVGKNILAKVLLARLLIDDSPDRWDWARGVFLRIESTLEIILTLVTEGTKSERFR